MLRPVTHHVAGRQLERAVGSWQQGLQTRNRGYGSITDRRQQVICREDIMSSVSRSLPSFLWFFSFRF
jgi:hypothetical protein